MQRYLVQLFCFQFVFVQRILSSSFVFNSSSCKGCCQALLFSIRLRAKDVVKLFWFQFVFVQRILSSSFVFNSSSCKGCCQLFCFQFVFVQRIKLFCPALLFSIRLRAKDVVKLFWFEFVLPFWFITMPATMASNYTSIC